MQEGVRTEAACGQLVADFNQEALKIRQAGYA
jgi:hypothetical protein